MQKKKSKKLKFSFQNQIVIIRVYKDIKVLEREIIKNFGNNISLNEIKGFKDESNRFIPFQNFTENLGKYFSFQKFDIIINEHIRSKYSSLLSNKFTSENINQYSKIQSQNQSFQTTSNHSNVVRIIDDYKYAFQMIISNKKNCFFFITEQKEQIKQSICEVLSCNRQNFVFFQFQIDKIQQFFNLYQQLFPQFKIKQPQNIIQLFINGQLVKIFPYSRNQSTIENLLIKIKNRYKIENEETQEESCIVGSIEDFKKFIFDFIENLYKKKINIAQYLKLNFIFCKNQNLIQSFYNLYQQNVYQDIIETKIVLLLDKMKFQPNDIEQFFDQQDVFNIFVELQKKDEISLDDFNQYTFLIQTSFLKNDKDFQIELKQGILDLMDQRISLKKFLQIFEVYQNYLNQKEIEIQFQQQQDLIKYKEEYKNIINALKSYFSQKNLNRFKNMIDENEDSIIDIMEAYVESNNQEELIETLQLLASDNKSIESKDKEDHKKNQIAATFMSFGNQMLGNKNFNQDKYESNAQFQNLLSTDNICNKNNYTQHDQNLEDTIFFKESQIEMYSSDSEFKEFEKITKSFKSAIENQVNQQNNLSTGQCQQFSEFNNSNLKDNNNSQPIYKGSFLTGQQQKSQIKTHSLEGTDIQYKKKNIFDQDIKKKRKKRSSNLISLKLFGSDQDLSEYSNQSNSQGTLSQQTLMRDREIFLNDLYDYLISLEKKFLDQIFESILKVFKDNFQLEEFFLFKKLLIETHYNDNLLELYFDFKFTQKNQKQNIFKIYKILRSIEKSTYSQQSSTGDKRNECINFIIQFYKYHQKQEKISSIQLKFLIHKLLLFDDEFLLGNFEYYLIKQQFKEFLENFQLYTHKYLQSTFAINNLFQEDDNNLEEIQQLFPGLIHHLPNVKLREQFLILVRLRIEDIMQCLFGKNLYPQNVPKLIKNIINVIQNKQQIIRQYYLDFQDQIKKEWFLELADIINSFQEQNIKKIPKFEKLINDLQKGTYKNNPILKDIKDQYDKEKNNENLIQQLSNFHQKKILNNYKPEVKELIEIFEDSNFSQEQIDQMIFIIFLTDSQETQDARDFYQIYQIQKNKNLFCKQVSTFLQNID